MLRRNSMLMLTFQIALTGCNQETNQKTASLEQQPGNPPPLTAAQPEDQLQPAQTTTVDAQLKNSSATVEDDKGTLVAVIPDEFGIIDYLNFSPDGQSVTYIGEANGSNYRIINDKILDRQPVVTFGGGLSLIFSPKGHKLAYKVDKGNTQYIVMDGKEGPAFDEVWEPVFSPDSTKVAYFARNEQGSFVIIGSRREQIAEEGEVGDIVFSPDGNRVAYSVTEGRLAYVVVPGQREGPVYDAVGGLTFSPDGRQLAYWACYGDQMFVVLNNKRAGLTFKKPDILYFDTPVFSPDSKSLTYRGWRGEKQFFVVGGKEGRLFDEVDDFVYSPDGKQYAYVARTGGKSFVITTILPSGRSAEYEAAWEPRISPDGKSVAYFFALPGLKKYGVALNGRAGPLVDDIDLGSLTFSTDSRQIFYGGRIGRQLWRKVRSVP